MCCKTGPEELGPEDRCCGGWGGAGLVAPGPSGHHLTPVFCMGTYRQLPLIEA